MLSTNLLTIADAGYRAQLRAKFLGDAIPATSFAAGANRIEAWGNDRNLDYSDCTASPWPQKSGDANLWYHSDLKNIAYRFVYSLFVKIIQEEPK